MSSSIRIATIRGIDIKVHWSFVLILAYGAWTWGQIGARSYPRDESALIRGAVYGMVLVMTLFAIVVLHELGHGIAAQYFKLPVKDITLFPLGGVARIERQPEKPQHELVIAGAGPAVNVLLALALFPLLVAAAGTAGISSPREVLTAYTELSVLGFVTYLAVTNLLLALFNMLPAFPMDGGRILRAALALAMGFTAATRVAVVVGRALALVMGLVGLIQGNVLLILIAAFVYFGAGQEGQEVQVRDALQTIRAGDAYNRQALAVGVGQPVATLAETMMSSYQTDFAVLLGSQLAGVVTREQVLAQLRAGRRSAPVGEIMDRDFVRVTPDTSLYEVRMELARVNKTVAAVMERDIFFGLVSLADISEVFALVTASPQRPATPDEADGPQPANPV